MRDGMQINDASLNRQVHDFLVSVNLGHDANRAFMLERGRARQALLISVVFEVQQLEPVGYIAAAPLCGYGCLSGLGQDGLWEGLSALVHIPINLAVLVLPTRMSAQGYCKQKVNHSQPAHHASSSEHGVVHRVGLEIAVAALKIDLDNDQIVDVI